MVGSWRKAEAWHHASFAWGLLCRCGQSRLGCVHLETWTACKAMLAPCAAWRLGAQLDQLLEGLRVPLGWRPHATAGFSSVSVPHAPAFSHPVLCDLLWRSHVSPHDKGLPVPLGGGKEACCLVRSEN